MKLKIGQGVDGNAVIAAFRAMKPFRLSGPGVDVELRAVELGRSWEPSAELLDLEFQQLEHIAWTGEGLPPVGLEIEVLFDSRPPKYITAKVIGHDGGKAVYRFVSGRREGEYESDKPGLFDGREGLPMFRPIRTPDQIAAEERAKAVSAMLADAGITESAWNDDPETVVWAEALYDAGYRKQVTP